MPALRRSLRPIVAAFLYLSGDVSAGVAGETDGVGPDKDDLIELFAGSNIEAGKELSKGAMKYVGGVLERGGNAISFGNSVLEGKEKGQDNAVALARGAFSWGVTETAVEVGLLAACPETAGLSCGAAVAVGVGVVAGKLSTNAYDSAIEMATNDDGSDSVPLDDHIRDAQARYAVDSSTGLISSQPDDPAGCIPGKMYWEGGCDWGFDPYQWQANWPDDDGPSYEQWLRQQAARAAQRNQPQGNQGGGADCSPAARMRHAMSDPTPMYWCGP